ncbi:MAG: alpha/beta hydrolase fold domain-containing protein [Bacteroidetes bacterium]|nr:alpha/beta hydrolase fold domain-containing protein [Bacteroidota bacterium]
MKKYFVISFFLMAVSASAQKIVPLYEGRPPGNKTDENKEEFTRPENGRPTVKNVTIPTLTYYLPAHADAGRGAVIICPGGGYLNLSIEDGGYDIAKEFAAAGISAFVLKYRTWVSGAFENYRDIPLQDLNRAMEIIHAHAAEWKIDTANIGLMGLSAGGHLAAMGSIPGKIGRRVAYTMLIYPVVSFQDSLTSPRSKTRKTLLGDNPSAAEKITFSPELHVSKNTPPAFVVQAEDDSTSMVGNSLAYYEALVAHEVPGRLLIYQKGGHGFALHNKAEGADWMPDAIKWMGLNGFRKASSAAAAPFWNEIAAFKEQDKINPPPASPILFVGSSSFRKWTDVNQAFPGYPIINRGFGGSILTDVIRYAYDIIIPYKPKQVVIYCGENDLATPDHIPASEVVNRFKTLFTIIRQNLPAATIDFVSIKPSPVRAAIQGKVIEANKAIGQFLQRQPNAHFINVYNAMLDAKGNMRKELFLEDMLHMRPNGYAIWKEIMLPYLKK